MAKSVEKRYMAATLFVLVVLFPCLHLTDAQIGVCYGRIGDNLPNEQDTVNLYKSNGITRMRIYDPDQAALQALKGSGISLLLDVPNDQLQSLAGDPSAAANWVSTNVSPFASSGVTFRYIAVGNEVEPNSPQASSVLPAMQNILTALNNAGLGRSIKVSTAIKYNLFDKTFPPSNTVFSGDAMQYITPIVNFLKSNGSPLLVNIYPYFAYTGSSQIDINYALFTSPGTVVTDTGNGLQYQNLFDAMVDGVYAALQKVGAGDTAVVVSESGWPSDGGNAATVQNAGTYYKNLVNHVKQGTPLKKGEIETYITPLKKGEIETYLFAMYDEDQKRPPGTEQHFGLFTPDKQPKYQINFS